MKGEKLPCGRLLLYGLQAMHIYPQISGILERQIVPICCLGRWCQTHFSPVTLSTAI